MTNLKYQTSPNYFRIALQSAFAASLCLGLPAGLLFWLIVFRETSHSAPISQIVILLQDNGWIEISILFIGVLIWGLLLGKLSGYRSWWWIVMASVFGISAGRWSPLANLDGWLSGLPVHVVFAAFLSGYIFSVTFCTGLAYGLILRNGKAAVVLALSASLVSVLTTVVTIVILDQLGIRVGTGNAAMPKVTAVCTMVAAISVGTLLGVGFSWFAEMINQPADLS